MARVETIPGNGQIICLPPNLITILRSYLDDPEYLSRPITADSMQRTLLVLGATLTEAVITGTDKYRVDDSFIFLVNKIRAHVKSVTPGTTEALTYSGVAVTDPDKVRSTRMLNCQVSLALQSRNEFLIGTQGDNSSDVCLYDLSPQNGGEIDFGEFPAIVPPGETLKLQVDLIDGDNALESAAGAEYGLLVTGLLLRRKGGKKG